MNKQTIVSLVVIIIGVAGLVWWSKSVENRELNAKNLTKSYLAKTEDALVASETFYDFGTISMKNGNVRTGFKVINPSKEDIKISSLYTSCMCTEAYILSADGDKKGPFGMPGHGGAVPKANEIVKAGESVEIEVVFDPTAHGPAGIGLIERAVLLEGENKNIVEFKFRASVTP